MSDYITGRWGTNDPFFITSSSTTAGVNESIPGTGNARPYTVYLGDHGWSQFEKAIKDYHSSNYTYGEWLFDAPCKKALNKNIRVI